MITPEEIAQHYTAALDSVSVIDFICGLDSPDQDDLDTVSRNIEHLEIMVSRSYWTTEDLQPFYTAITVGKRIL